VVTAVVLQELAFWTPFSVQMMLTVMKAKHVDQNPFVSRISFYAKRMMIAFKALSAAPQESVCPAAV
jgi:hypothetical protein